MNGKNPGQEEWNPALLEISSNGRKAKYSRTISATVQYDNGTVELTEPSTETAYGEEAINEATEGLWNALTDWRENK